jgi:hypothetical protein
VEEAMDLSHDRLRDDDDDDDDDDQILGKALLTLCMR